MKLPSNKNEETSEDEEAESGQVEDLAVEENAQVVGGRTEGTGQGGPVFNHNETTAEEDESTTGLSKICR
jgi:hypothetical protein